MFRAAQARWPFFLGTSALVSFLLGVPRCSDATTATPTATRAPTPTATPIDCGPVHTWVDPVTSSTDALTQVVSGTIDEVRGPLTRLRVCGEAGCVFVLGLPAQPTYNYAYTVTVDLVADAVNHLEVCALNCPGEDSCTRRDRNGGLLDIAQGSPPLPTPPETPGTPSPTPTPIPTPTAVVCTGDCDDNSHVTVDELVTGIDITLGNLSLDACPAVACDGSQTVPVYCLARAVNAALSDCGSP